MSFRFTDYVRQFFPNLDEGGVCLGFTLSAKNALLSKQVPHFEERNLAMVEIKDSAGMRVAPQNLRTLLDDLKKQIETVSQQENELKRKLETAAAGSASAQHSEPQSAPGGPTSAQSSGVPSKETSLESKIKEPDEVEIKTSPPENYLPQAQKAYDALKKEFPITDLTLTPEDELKLAEFLVLPETKEKTTSEVKIETTPVELKTEINLAWQIRNESIKLAKIQQRVNELTHKLAAFYTTPPYIAQLNELGIYIQAIGLQHDPEKFQELLDVAQPKTTDDKAKTQSLFSQLINPAVEWLTPVILDSQGGVIQTSATARFSIKSFQTNLENLEKQLQAYYQQKDKKGIPDDLAFSLQVDAMGHSLTLGYRYHPEPEKSKWLLLDINNKEKSKVRTLSTQEVGRIAFQRAANANLYKTVTLSGRHYQFNLAFHTETNTFVLLSAEKKEDPNQSTETEKIVLAALANKKMLSINNLTQNFTLKAATTGQLKSALMPFISAWQASQKLTKDMVTSTDDLNKNYVLHHHCINSVDKQTIDDIIKAGGDVNQRDGKGFTPIERALAYNNVDVAVHLLLKHNAKITHLITNQLDKLKNYIANSVTVNSQQRTPSKSRSIFRANTINVDQILDRQKEQEEAQLFKQHLMKLLEEKDEENIFPALQKRLAMDPKQINLFASDDPFLNKIFADVGYSDVEAMDRDILKKPFWTHFWNDLSSQPHTAEINVMKEKILYLLRQWILKKNSLKYFSSMRTQHEENAAQLYARLESIKTGFAAMAVDKKSMADASTTRPRSNRVFHEEKDEKKSLPDMKEIILKFIPKEFSNDDILRKEIAEHLAGIEWQFISKNKFQEKEFTEYVKQFIAIYIAEYRYEKSEDDTNAPQYDELIEVILEQQESLEDLQFPIHLAVRDPQADTLIKLLAENKCDLNVTDDKGDTPLHLAVELNRSTAIQALLAQKTHPEEQNHAGKTPFDIALANNNWTVATALILANNRYSHYGNNLIKNLPEHAELAISTCLNDHLLDFYREKKESSLVSDSRAYQFLETIASNQLLQNLTLKEKVDFLGELDRSLENLKKLELENELKDNLSEYADQLFSRYLIQCREDKSIRYFREDIFLPAFKQAKSIAPNENKELMTTVVNLIYEHDRRDPGGAIDRNNLPFLNFIIWICLELQKLPSKVGMINQDDLALLNKFLQPLVTSSLELINSYSKNSLHYRASEFRPTTCDKLALLKDDLLKSQDETKANATTIKFILDFLDDAIDVLNKVSVQESAFSETIVTLADKPKFLSAPPDFNNKNCFLSLVKEYIQVHSVAQKDIDSQLIPCILRG